MSLPTHLKALNAALEARDDTALRAEAEDMLRTYSGEWEDYEEDED